MSRAPWHFAPRTQPHTLLLTSTMGRPAMIDSSAEGGRVGKAELTVLAIFWPRCREGSCIVEGELGVSGAVGSPVAANGFRTDYFS